MKQARAYLWLAHRCSRIRRDQRPECAHYSRPWLRDVLGSIKAIGRLKDERGTPGGAPFVLLQNERQVDIEVRPESVVGKIRPLGSVVLRLERKVKRATRIRYTRRVTGGTAG